MGLWMTLKKTPKRKSACEIQAADLQRYVFDDPDVIDAEDGCKDVYCPSKTGVKFGCADAGWWGDGFNETLNRTVGTLLKQEIAPHVKGLERFAFELGAKAFPKFHGAEIQAIFGYWDDCERIHKEQGINTHGEMTVQVPDWKASAGRGKAVRRKFERIVEDAGKKGKYAKRIGIGKQEWELERLEEHLNILDLLIEMAEWVDSRKDKERYYLHFG